MAIRQKIPILAIVGPTASGKTDLAVSLALKYNAEILSFDSMQLYKGMDIATAKPTTDEMCGIPHHMISVMDSNASFSVAMYKNEADRIIKDIHSRNKNVIMVGGTGLYLDTVANNIEMLPGQNVDEIRESLKNDLATFGPEEMHRRLYNIDPKSAEQIHMNNTGRVLRALEVYYSTGHTMSYQVENSRKNESPYEVTYIGLTAQDRDYLYGRINCRVDLMMENGLLNEAKFYADNPLGNTAKQAIGIKELIPYFNGEKTLDECIEHLKQETRRYAKRQLTWFKRNSEVNWLYIDLIDSKQELVNQAEAIVEKLGVFQEV